MATARAIVADIRPWQLRSAARTASPPKLSRENVVFLQKMSFSAAFSCGRHYFSPHKMVAKNHRLSWHCRFKPITFGNELRTSDLIPKKRWVGLRCGSNPWPTRLEYGRTKWPLSTATCSERGRPKRPCCAILLYVLPWVTRACGTRLAWSPSNASVHQCIGLASATSPHSLT